MNREKRFKNVEILDIYLNKPHRNYPIIHVTGTDGKGSTSSMIASILIEAGYKVGTYNTPSMGNRCNIIKINGTPISLKKLNQLSNNIEKCVLNNNLYYVVQKNNKIFINGRTIESGFLYFKEENVDIAVIEAEIGAATDNTGLVNPIVSVLTNITSDHLEEFNNDYILYAQEKAGIIKQNTSCLVGETPTNDDAFNILKDKAKKYNASLTFTDKKENNLIIEYLGNGHYNTKFGEFTMSLGGDYQYNNLNLVLNTILELRKQGYTISDEDIVNGLEKIYENTKFFGRWQTLNKKPKIILDCCHTIDAWNKVLCQISKMNYNKLHIIYQASKDKPLKEIISLFPDKENVEYWFPKPTSKTLEAPEKIMDIANLINHSKKHITENLIDTIKMLLNEMGEDDVIFIGGTCKNGRRVIDSIDEIIKNKKNLVFLI